MNVQAGFAVKKHILAPMTSFKNRTKNTTDPIHGISPSYLQSCFTRVAHMTSRRRLRSSTSHRSARSSVYGRQAGVSGFWCHRLDSATTCLSTSHLSRHSRSSDNDSRPFCFPVPTKTLSYDSCVTITIHHYCLDTCGPCNN